ncbi:MAG: J domain-containing protein [Acidimicrobiales bacterium]
MDTGEALAVLGISPGATADEARSAYRRLIRTAHPDRSGGDPAATHQTARLTQAYAVIRSAIQANGGSSVPAAPPPPRPPAPPPGGRPAATRWPYDGQAEPVDADLLEGDTIAVHAPAEEAFALLFEAAGRVGHIAYFDRQLGILETVVRFEGGPTCSVLITLQGRAMFTEAFCTMESIEAAPTPSIQPVVEAIVDELVHPSPET